MGKSFWLHTEKRFSSEQGCYPGFITAAAPSGTAAYLIGGSTLHSLLSLPVRSAEMVELGSAGLQLLQKDFEHMGILVIDEKSMTGHKIFVQIDKRLKQIQPKWNDFPFGGLSMVLFWAIGSSFLLCWTLHFSGRTQRHVKATISNNFLKT